MVAVALIAVALVLILWQVHRVRVQRRRWLGLAEAREVGPSPLAEERLRMELARKRALDRHASRRG